jgi:hypothetical protein
MVVETAIDYKTLSEEYAFQITALKQELAILKKLILAAKMNVLFQQTVLLHNLV